MAHLENLEPFGRSPETQSNRQLQPQSIPAKEIAGVSERHNLRKEREGRERLLHRMLLSNIPRTSVSGVSVLSLGWFDFRLKGKREEGNLSKL